MGGKRKRLTPFEIQRLGSLEYKKGAYLNYPLFKTAKKLLKKGLDKMMVSMLTGLSEFQVQMIKTGRIDKTRWKKTSKNIKDGK